MGYSNINRTVLIGASKKGSMVAGGCIYAGSTRGGK